MDGHHTATATGFSEIVSNGEIGQVIAMDAKRAVVKLLYPLRHVVIPLSSGGGEDSAGNAFDLAYAITCHKAQGSQVPVIIEMVDDSYGAGFVTSREWHYTGISRAEDLCLSIGKWDVLMGQCKIQSLQKRKTRLAEILKGELA
jgi:exodeoxyribonuclease V alpha subunit